MIKTFCAFVLALLFTLRLEAAEPGPKSVTLTVDGVERTAVLFATESASKASAPLVFAFHGHGGGSKQAALSFRIHQAWPEAIVVYPQGLPTPGRITDPEGKKAGWQMNPGDQGNRDLKFFDALLTKLKNELKVDEKRIFSMGHSNGAGFTYLLWAQRGETFAALGPSAGFWAGIRTSKMTPMPMIHFAGRKDPLVKFTWQSLAVDQVKKINRVSEAKGEAWETKATLYAADGGVPTVVFFHDGGHEYHKDTTELIVKFFKGQKKL